MIQNDKVRVMYEPAHYMVLDFLTKSLKGKLFSKIPDTLLGLEKGDYTLLYTKYKKMKSGIK